MWSEGLATYVSQRMNPGLDAQQVLWYPPDMVTRMDRDLAHAALLMLQDIEKPGSVADRWFLADQSVDELPRRAGYYLGYLFAKSEGDGKALPRLARMPPDQVHAKAVRFLMQLSHAPGSRALPRDASPTAPASTAVTERMDVAMAFAGAGDAPR
jgi:hypothetical protein